MKSCSQKIFANCNSFLVHMRRVKDLQVCIRYIWLINVLMHNRIKQ